MKLSEGVTEDANNDLVIFQDAGQPVEVRLDPRSDTVWLTQRQMSALFEATPESVFGHLENISQDEELPKQATTEDFFAVQTEGKLWFSKHLLHRKFKNISAARTVHRPAMT